MEREDEEDKKKTTTHYNERKTRTQRNQLTAQFISTLCEKLSVYRFPPTCGLA